MLYSFDNYFWKTIGILLFSWIIYLFWGFEFSVITLLALILAKNK